MPHIPLTDTTSDALSYFLCFNTPEEHAPVPPNKVFFVVVAMKIEIFKPFLTWNLTKLHYFLKLHYFFLNFLGEHGANWFIFATMVTRHAPILPSHGYMQSGSESFGKRGPLWNHKHVKFAITISIYHVMHHFIIARL